MFENQILEVEQLPTNNFVDLVKAAGLNPSEDFRDSDLRGLDLSNCELNGFDFRGSDLRDTNFDSSDLRGVVLDDDQRELPAIRSILETLNKSTNQADKQAIKHKIIDISAGGTSKKIGNYLNTLQYLAGDISNLTNEGGLAPGRYAVKVGEQRQNVINHMFAKQMENLNAAWEIRNQDKAISNHLQLLTFASIIELEAFKYADKLKIAGIYKNRLERGMMLLSTATATYGYYGPELVYPIRMFRKILMDRNKFNTCVHAGLPPSPVCNPSNDTISVSAIAEPSDYLFFCPDGLGGFNFAKTFEENVHFLRVYQQNSINKDAEADILPAL